MIESISPVQFLLASLLTSYPDEGFKSIVETLFEDENLRLPTALRGQIADALATANKLDDLRSEYIFVFDQSKELNPLYETEYGRERAMFKANELADIAGFYRAFGFEMGGEDGTPEMPDHVSVEFEFYSLLLMKYGYLADNRDEAGCAIVADAQKKFLREHLGRFVPAIAERPGVVASPFYSALFGWCSEVVRAEAARIGVELERATWFSNQAEKDDVCCGATVTMGK